MKTTSILLATVSTILAACSGDPGAGRTAGERIVMSAEVQKEGIQYLEVTHASSEEEVVAAYDAKGAVVFSIDYVSNAAHTQKTITLSSARVSRTRTVAETPVSSTATGNGTIRPEMTKECAQAYEELIVAWITDDSEALEFYEDSIDAFGC
jgi:hypothetical protein